MQASISATSGENGTLLAPYIFMERNGIHIIDLYKTMAKIEEAARL